MSSKKLTRSTKDRILAGVLGGLGEHLGIDPNILRMIAVVLFIFSPTLILVAYFAAVLLIPKAGEEKPIIAKLELEKHAPLLIGLILVIVGAGMLGSAAGSSIFWTFKPGLAATLTQIVAASILILVGLILLVPRLRSL
ncbi:MAG: PspC domain-containing protein [Thaumarchaeota archaeon]|nr:PspC domain-containing protein [Nitrososphaerota archaeon]